ncbi:hypothetical protein NMY22_g11911 [Coprinellus aureogranulatus]|nr:hypothetical protein NMY22_g11911 [Coprinellus aureogranulatus]
MDQLRRGVVSNIPIALLSGSAHPELDTAPCTRMQTLRSPGETNTSLLIFPGYRDEIPYTSSGTAVVPLSHHRDWKLSRMLIFRTALEDLYQHHHFSAMPPLFDVTFTGIIIFSSARLEDLASYGPHGLELA